MITKEQQQRIKELDEQIEILMQEKEKINPYSNLKSLSNKEFGEGFSENLIARQCPQLIHVSGKGYDFLSDKIGKIEVKSSRLPCKHITLNQLHPKDCDYFLFALYDTENADELFYLISSDNLVTTVHCIPQHDRNNNTCFSIFLSKTNKQLLEPYKMNDWEELRLVV